METVPPLRSRQASRIGITISSLRAFSLTNGSCMVRANISVSQVGGSAGAEPGNRSAGSARTPNRSATEIRVKSENAIRRSLSLGRSVRPEQ